MYEHPRRQSEVVVLLDLQAIDVGAFGQDLDGNDLVVRTSDWFVSDNPKFESYLRDVSPEPYRARGVFVDPDSLEPV